MKRFLFSCLLGLSCQYCSCQDTLLHKLFCDNLQQVLESGRMENFESIRAHLFKTIPVMDSHQPVIDLPRFPRLAIDKDLRFIAKTLLNMDSLTAVKELDVLKPYVLSCLDSTKWVWHERLGDDTTTVFFREYKELYATDGIITITLAMVGVGTKVYSANMYIRRNNTRIKR